MTEKTDKQQLPANRAVMAKQVMYEDGFGVRAGVSYDSHYRLGNEPDRFVKIEGVGGDVHLHMRDVAFVIEALTAAQDIDERTHS
jgi:hypothetical protein